MCARNFLPAVMKDVLTGKSSVLKADANRRSMMIHPLKDSSPGLASGNWDGGKPEAERRFGDCFPGDVIAIKYRNDGRDIGTRFLHYNYMVWRHSPCLWWAESGSPTGTFPER